MSAIRLLLDEDVRRLLGELLRERGFDAVHVVSEGLRAADDEEVLDYAVQEQRTLLTHNTQDFVELAADYSRKGWEHHGIIVAAHAPIGELLARALRLLAQKRAEDMVNALEWLHNYR